METKKEDVKIEALTPEAKKAKEEAEAKAKAETESNAEQDLLKIELERVKKGELSEKERAEYNLKKNAERVKELGGNPSEILGVKPEIVIEEDDDKPLTVGAFKKIQQMQAKKSALQLADEIQNETERELVKFYLNNRIIPSGNSEEDFKFARVQANAVKNAQIMEEINRKVAPKSFSNASGVDKKQEQQTGELTAVEKKFLGKPWKMTKEQIISLRGKSLQQKQVLD